MKRNTGFALMLVLILVLGLAFAGCGQSEADDDEGRVENGDDKGVNDKENGDAAPGNGAGDFDFSDPDEVFITFWEYYSAGDFDRAGLFLSPDARSELQYFRSVYEANPYALALWKLFVGDGEANITGRGISGDWMVLNVQILKPDFDSLVETVEGEEIVITLLMLLALSGFDMDDMNEMAKESGMKFSEGAWSTAFAEFESALKKLPAVQQSIQVELIEQDGKWQVDELPMDGLF